MVPILLFGSQEDRRLPELLAGESYSSKASRCAGGEGGGGGGESGWGAAQERTGILRKRWEINNLKAAALPFSLHFPLKRLSNQFAPRNMLIANGAH